MSSERYLGIATLHARLDHKRRERKTTWRAIAEDTRIPHSTFTRLRNGGGIHADALLSLMHWLGETDITPYSATRRNQPSSVGGTTTSGEEQP